MNMRIKTALAIIGAAMTAVSVTGITVTLTRPAEQSSDHPAPVAPTATPEAVPTPDLAGAREAAERSVRRFYAGDPDRGRPDPSKPVDLKPRLACFQSRAWNAT